MKTNIGISDKNRKVVVEILNQILADEYVLYTKSLKFHWNVESDNFSELHAFFKEHYEKLLEMADDVAERARSLGGNAFGTLEEFLQHTNLAEEVGKIPDATDMIEDLLTDHETIIQHLRKSLEVCTEHGDAGTSNFLTDLMEKHEKMAWMLRAFIH